MKERAKNSFSRQVSILRQDSGLTQPELATKMGVSVRTVSGWETGERTPRNSKRLLEEIRKVLQAKELPHDNSTLINMSKEDIMYREKCEDLQDEIAGLHRKLIKALEDNSLLERELRKKRTPLTRKSKEA